MRYQVLVAAIVAIFIAPANSYGDPIETCSSFSAPCTSALISNESTFEHVADTQTTSVQSGTEQVISGFGVNGIRAASLEAVVQSEFIDTFLISGGTGAGVISVQWELDGTMSIPGPSAECSGPSDPDVIENDPGCAMRVFFLGLFNFPRPLNGPIVLRNMGAPAGQTVSLSGTIDVPFTFGVLFRGGFALSGGTSETEGMLDFLNTAEITSLILPPGASLQTGSGTVYPQDVAAIPEPSTLLLVGSALAVTLRSRRMSRDRKRMKDSRIS